MLKKLYLYGLSFTLKPGLFIKNHKRADVRVNPLKGFTLITASIKYRFNLPVVSVRRQNGFTLIELLVVLGVLTLAVGAITVFMTSVLRGAQKANAVNEVKQNSQIIIDSLERQIRGSQDAVNIGTEKKTIKLSRGTSESIYLKCLDGKANVRNSRFGIAKLSDSLVSSDNGPDDEFYISVSNDDTVDGVSVENCKLTVYPATNSPKGLPVPAVVSIEMDIVKKAERVEYSAETSIQTTISLRRY